MKRRRKISRNSLNIDNPLRQKKRRKKKKKKNEISSDYNKIRHMEDKINEIFTSFLSIKNEVIKKRFISFLTKKLSEFKKTTKKKKPSGQGGKKKKKKKSDSLNLDTPKASTSRFIKSWRNSQRKKKKVHKIGDTSFFMERGRIEEDIENKRMDSMKKIERKLHRAKTKVINIRTTIQKKHNSSKNRKSKKKKSVKNEDDKIKMISQPSQFDGLTIKQSEKMYEAIKLLMETSEEMFDVTKKVQEDIQSENISRDEVVEMVSSISSYYFNVHKNRKVFSLAPNIIGADILNSKMLS